MALAGGVALARVAQRAARARATAPASPPCSRPWRSWAGAASASRSPRRSARRCSGGSRRAARPLVQVLACAAVRVLHERARRGLLHLGDRRRPRDAYAGSYDAIAERFGFNVGERATVYVTLAGLLVWGAFASAVQVRVYRRGLREWRPGAGEGVRHRQLLPRAGAFRSRARSRSPPCSRSGSCSPAPSGWCSLPSPPGWGWRGCSRARTTAPCPRGWRSLRCWPAGALIFTLTSGLGLGYGAAAGPARAGLLVLVAAWLRAAAGAHGLERSSGACSASSGGSRPCPRPHGSSTGSARKGASRRPGVRLPTSSRVSAPARSR